MWSARYSCQTITQKAQLVSILVNEPEEEEEMTKAQLVARIREGLEEVKLCKQGKITFQSAKDLLDELYASEQCRGGATRKGKRSDD